MPPEEEILFEPDEELDWWAYTADLQVVFEQETEDDAA